MNGVACQANAATVTRCQSSHEPKGNGRHSELRAMISLAIPVVFVQFGFMGMGAVDTLMVGRISATMLAAVALGNLCSSPTSIFSAGTLMALDPLVAQAIGAGDTESVARAMQRGLLITIGLSAMTAAILAPATPILRALHQPREIVVDAASYLHISIVGILPFLKAFVVLRRQSLQAMHRVAPIVWTIVIANGTNALLNWVFVYGHLGSPARGVAGSAIATAISRWLMTILLLVFAWRGLEPNLFPIRDDSWQWTPIRRMLKIAAPIGAQQALEAGAFAAIVVWLHGGDMAPPKCDRDCSVRRITQRRLTSWFHSAWPRRRQCAWYTLLDRATTRARDAIRAAYVLRRTGS